MKKITIFYLFCLMTVSANAGNGFDFMIKEWQACQELSDYRQTYGCYQNLLEESDKLLNKEYKALSDYLTDDNKANLLDAQRKWIKFRDADCLFSDPREKDNSIISSNKAACLANRTIERLKHLENYNSSWNKGCNGCPW